MIQLKEYNRSFESLYFNKVEEIVKKIDDGLEKRMIESSKKYLPTDFYESDNELRQLVLAPYHKLKNAYRHIKKNETTKNNECFHKDNKLTTDYQWFHDAYDKVRSSMIKIESDRMQMNVGIVHECGTYVCPYCNRDFINSRAENISGAQLDHFYSRKDYPIFALSLYNLVPVCGNCNRVKSKSDNDIVSPFDKTENFETGILFSYSYGKVCLKGSGNFKKNIETMHLEEAYQIHDKDAKELIEKSKIYTESQLEEIHELLKKGKGHITMKTLKEHIYGRNLNLSNVGKWPLSKFKYDILKQRSVI